tara:strand:+ start:147 stop:404 length:258 start_codon:yes stop_codon:yes gene_type:complete
MSFVTVTKRRSMGSRIPLPGQRVLPEGPYNDMFDRMVRRRIDGRLDVMRDAQRELKAAVLAEMWAEEDAQLGIGPFALPVPLHRR